MGDQTLPLTVSSRWGIYGPTQVATGSYHESPPERNAPAGFLFSGPHNSSPPTFSNFLSHGH